MNANREWLDNLKVGDKVAMEHGGYQRYWSILTVVRRTAKQIMCRSGEGPEHKFWAIDGSSVGSRCAIEPVTDKVRAANRRLINIGKLSRIDWSKMSDDHLDAVAKLVRKLSEPSTT